MEAPYTNGARARRVAVLWRLLSFAICLVLAGCRASKGPAAVKPASAYRADLFQVAEKINDYLAKNTPGNTPRAELQQAVGEMAHEFTMLAAEAGPLRGKTGDAEYGAVAARAEDGVIVAGNLAGALAADPAKRPDAVSTLASAVDDWVAFNAELVDDATAAVPFGPNRWWETPRWRRALGTEGE
jgi:hypothetical protein